MCGFCSAGPQPGTTKEDTDHAPKRRASSPEAQVALGRHADSGDQPWIMQETRFPENLYTTLGVSFLLGSHPRTEITWTSYTERSSFECGDEPKTPQGKVG